MLTDMKVPGPWANPAPEGKYGFCKQGCYGAQQLYIWGGRREIAPHMHYECWNCQGDSISTVLGSYVCYYCGCGENAYYPAKYPEYDPELAAALSSPG